MATNKHAIIRYQTLDKCFSNRYKLYDMEALVEACCQAIYDFTGIREGVKRRQIYDDITFMESDQGWSIELQKIKDGRKVYYRYLDTDFSINKSPLSEHEVQQLKETTFMLSRFKGLPHFEWIEELVSKLEDQFHLVGNSESVIGFEQNPYLTGLEHLSHLFNAIVNKQPLRITYQSFRGGKMEWNIHPYYIKQYNQRWFLLGCNDEYRTITNIPLDRIQSFEPVAIHYIESDIDFFASNYFLAYKVDTGKKTLVLENCDYSFCFMDKSIHTDFDEYFDDVIGVTIPKNKEVCEILLQFTEQRYSYIISKPLHWSQKIKDADQRIVSISVIPNKELISLILSFGDDVVVLSPNEIREELSKQITSLQQKYNVCR